MGRFSGFRLNTSLLAQQHAAQLQEMESASFSTSTELSWPAYH